MPLLKSDHQTDATARIERAGADEDDAFTPADAIRVLLGWPCRPRPERRPPSDDRRGAKPEPK